MIEVAQLYLAKAEESLEGAESEFSNHRYNNCANRCYYACFQAAVSALISNGIEPSRGEWGHAFVQAQFAGELVNRRRSIPPDFEAPSMTTSSHGCGPTMKSVR